MRKSWIGALLAAALCVGLPALAGAGEESLAGCPLFPANNIWNVPVDTLPVDANSDAYIQTIGASTNVHADFGSGTWDGGPIGIPYNIVRGSQAKVSVIFDYSDESDPGPYPIPANPIIEYGSDHHILIVDQDNCMLYETWDSRYSGGQWHAGSGAIWDLNSNALRPDTWTSADAAGLPLLPGLIRYDEVASGQILHAIRFTVPQTRKAYIWPARHYASSYTATRYPPMGQRFRLKAGYDTSGLSHDARVIADAMKKYGILLADNGSSWYISGAPDERWNNDVLHELDAIVGSDFEAVNESSLMVDPNSGQAGTGGGGGGDHRLTVTVVGDGHVSSTPGGIDCPGGCSATFTGGSSVDLAATPGGGYEFVGWSGAASGGDPNTSVTMSADRSVTATFRQTSGSGWLQVDQPNGGEKWKLKSQRWIRWESSGVTGNVRIEVRDGTGSWKTIAAQTPNDGSFRWRVKGMPTTAALVRITSLNDNSIQDASNAVFTIR